MKPDGERVYNKNLGQTPWQKGPRGSSKKGKQWSVWICMKVLNETDRLNVRVEGKQRRQTPDYLRRLTVKDQPPVKMLRESINQKYLL